MTDAPRVSWRLAVAFAALLTLLFAVQNSAGQQLSFWVSLQRQATVWSVWLLLTPWVIRTARKYPLEERPSAKWIRKQLLIGGGFAIIHSVISGLMRSALGVAAYTDLSDILLASIVTGFGRNYLTYWFIAATYQSLIYHRTVRDRDAQAAQLELDLFKAKLETLEGRLRPHFLFNTLNTITALVRDDPPAAEAMLGQLSDLLRASLRAEPTREVRLDEELDLVDKYLAIQRVRFQDRLKATIDATGEARRCFVPHLILQPLVENAVRHGIAPREGPGAVWVRAERMNGKLRISIEDDGIGLGRAPASQAGTGIGLNGVRSRLAYLYTGEHAFEIEARRPTGTKVSIEIPYHTEERQQGA